MRAVPLQWFVVPALIALARQIKSTAQVFSTVDLSAWVGNDQFLFSEGTAEQALTCLERKGYATPEKRAAHTHRKPRRYYMTAAGLDAAQAALLALPGEAPDLQALPTRLWNLLRIRRRLTAAEAAATLVDADENFDAQTKRIGALLAAWAKHSPKTVAVAAKRENGRIRYVLTNDLGRWPPPARAGQIHPSDFSLVAPVPLRYRKAPAAADLAGCTAE